jgi:hypothetical protein
VADYTIAIQEQANTIDIEEQYNVIELGGLVLGAVTSVNGLVGDVIISDEKELMSGIAVGSVSALKAIVPVSGGYSVCDTSNIAHMGMVIGISATAASNGDTFTIVSQGEFIDDFWNFTVQAPVFITSSGSLTTTYDSSGKFSQQVGVALTGNSVLINICQPMKLVQ